MPEQKQPAPQKSQPTDKPHFLDLSEEDTGKVREQMQRLIEEHNGKTGRKKPQ